MWILGWIIGAFIAGAICTDRKFGFWGTFLISIIFSPVIGLIVGLLSGEKLNTPEENAEVITAVKWEDHYIEAQRLEFKHRYKEAIDKYQDFLFDIGRDTREWKPVEIERRDKRMSEVRERIELLKSQTDGEPLQEARP